MAESRKERRVSRLALFAALLGALALAFLPPQARSAATKKQLLVPGAFRLEASNGFTLYVLAMPPYAKRSGGVFIYASAKGRGVTYRAPATVSETSIEADLGELGEISVTFHRSGRASSILCEGREIRFDSGSYEGTISFHGEEGYASVEATTVPGNADYVRSICGESVFSGGFGGRRGAELYVRNPALGQGMSVSKRRPGAAAQISAWTREYTDRHVSIRRQVFLRVPGENFTYDRRLRTATVRAPAPFSGSATFDRRRKAGQRWSGDLTVDLPGKSGVPLTAPSLRAELVPSGW